MTLTGIKHLSLTHSLTVGCVAGLRKPGTIMTGCTVRGVAEGGVDPERGGGVGRRPTRRLMSR